MSARRSLRFSRGYLLLEAMVSGAVLALVLATSLSLIAGARADATYNARRQTAAELARAKLDELTARRTLANTSSALAVVDAVKFPGVRVGFTITDVSAGFGGLSPDGIDGQLFEIVVTAEHPTFTGPKQLSLRTLRRIR